MESFSLHTDNESAILVFLTDQPQPLVTDDIRRYISSLLLFMILVFGSLGVVTNIINIRVFIYQGLSSDSNTIGLFALAVADLVGCFCLIPNTFCDVLKYTPTPAHLYTSCDAVTVNFFHLTHLTMSRLTCWITVYIAIERCLCVLVPFKVKLLIRPQVAAVAMTSIYLVLIGSYIPLYVNIGLRRWYNPAVNATVINISQKPMAVVIGKYLGIVMNTIMSTVAIVVVAMTTGLMLYKLNKYKKWREKSAANAGGASSKVQTKGDKSESESTAQGKKDIEVLKTVVMVTGLFLACLSMSHFPGFAAAIVPGFSRFGVNRNLFNIFYRYKYVFDVINSSLNFFFYIHISTRYKVAYNAVFKKQKA